MYDDEDFEDLFKEDHDLLEPSSQELLIEAAANLASNPKEGASERQHQTGIEDSTIPGALPLNTTSFADTMGQNDFRPAVTLLPRACPNAGVLERVEVIFEEIVDAMLNDKPEIGITLKSRQRHSVADIQGTSAEGVSPTPSRRYCFPGRTADEAWRFSMVLRILELMHEALRNDVVISKRDIYYRDPALFGNQRYVDQYVDDIAYTFGMTRSHLNVSAAAKGLVAGAISFLRQDGSKVAASVDQEGMLVPSLKDVLSVEMPTVKWILVIEKEATFRSIAASNFWAKLASEGVILTGKGYPDLSTRALLHFLATPSSHNGFSSPRVYGLADFDPDGMAILSVYRHGSQALTHESKGHAVPQLQWLGLRSEHLNVDSYNTHSLQGLLPLTSRDRQQAMKMLDRSASSLSQDSTPRERELQTMLMLNVKAELQLLDAVPDGMSNLLASL
ncbi:Putative spo11/DNA topoisomerase VI subunit A, spo11/DNA topoisomerase VI, subunit A [Septoria linicola]|uniref:DNA topoisomerase (ATP-hydrolyzing) n=1 Tax=Septoria linicola TaxID=215465 RepID=A0A9Q9AKH5_9PEZI|nr:putative spo11/DNA topoisomerase VI subunit A, spo11/DNA topoisomerase VI, subunit A [Septoria linicola]USW50989.1 Putative spo11/DNA topoisomerase VI subunit A, spo11/DNA topoisomerase VI, subunit A [Septoria linicola]